MTLIIVLVVLLIVIGTPVTLIWWGMANKWAIQEHDPIATRTSGTDQNSGGSSRASGPTPSRGGPTVIRVADADADADAEAEPEPEFKSGPESGA